MDKIIIGIDPGQKGAITFLLKKKKGLRFLDVHDLPKVEKPFGRSGGTMIHAPKLFNLIGWYKKTFKIETIYLEHVHAMPKQGVVAVFSFGVTFGIILSTIMLSGVDIRLVTPANWKRKAGLTGKPKDSSIRKAIDIFPEATFRLTKKATDRADSILIAFFGAQLERDRYVPIDKENVRFDS